MGPDMVNDRRPRIFSLSGTGNAEGVFPKKCLALPLPAATITTPPSRSGCLWVQGFVCLAIVLTVGHQGRTAGMLTRCCWPVGH